MALGREVDKIVDVVLGKEVVEQFSVANIAFHEDATLTVDVLFDGSQIARVGQRVEDNHFNILVSILYVQQILDEISADKTGASRY